MGATKNKENDDEILRDDNEDHDNTEEKGKY